MRSIRRIVHTLKGDAAACGFRELSNAAHDLEDALALESASSHGSLAEVAFTAADTFGAMLTAYRRKGKLPSAAPLGQDDSRADAAAQRKEGLQEKDRQRRPLSAVAWTEYEKLAIQNAVTCRQACVPHHRCHRSEVRHADRSPATGAECPGPGRRSAGGASRGRVSSQHPASGIAGGQREDIRSVVRSLPDSHCDIERSAWNWSRLLSQRRAKQLLPKRQDTRQLQRRRLAPRAAGTGDEHAAAGRPNHPVLAENILRVDAERIDSVLNLVGELIIGRSMLQQAFTEFARHVPKEALRGRFSDAMAFQSRVLSDLQRSVMKIRMVPVEQLFRRFPRMVRDVAKQCGKEVELVMSGQDTDLDKSLLDAIAEPLTHLVRNAVSHGIESAEERVRNGKPARGTIHLTSYHHGNQVIVEVSDDGAGIDVEKVKAKALENGLVTRGRGGPAGRGRDSRTGLPARVQHRGRDHRSLRPRRRHGRGADRIASPEGLGRHRDPGRARARPSA